MKRSSRIALYVVGSVAVAAIAVVVVPPLIRALSMRQYRASSDISDIDFNNMGPEIVEKHGN